MNETQIKGLTTELECQLYFSKQGYNVSIPIAQDCRYDMILDIDHHLYKIQIKTSRDTGTQNGGFLFNTVSSRMNHTEGNMKKEYSEEDVDFFATSFENKIYLIPKQICQGQEKRLVKQYAKTSNTQADLMEDYEADKVIEKIRNNQPVVVTRGRRVQQYSFDGELIATYPTYSAAAKALGGDVRSSATHIGEVIRGKRKTALGYFWREEKV